MKNNIKIIVVILAGGLSKRFGGGVKTSAKINGTTIFEKIISNFLNQEVKILINSNSKNEIFSTYNFPIIKDVNKDYQGPLAGIYATMFWIKKKKLDIDWLLSVPSDTPFLPNNLISIFKKNIKKNKDIFIARSKNKIHPVIGLWNMKLLDKLENELKSENRKIMEWVYKNSYEFIDFSEDNYDHFFNINKKEDLFEAERIEKIIRENNE